MSTKTAIVIGYDEQDNRHVLCVGHPAETNEYHRNLIKSGGLEGIIETHEFSASGIVRKAAHKNQRGTKVPKAETEPKQKRTGKQ